VNKSICFNSRCIKYNSFVQPGCHLLPKIAICYPLPTCASQNPLEQMPLLLRGEAEISRVFNCSNYWIVWKSLIRSYLFDCAHLFLHGKYAFSLRCWSVGKSVPVYTLRDVVYNFRVEEFVSSSVFAELNVGTEIK
jgi:hypothetical protein